MSTNSLEYVKNRMAALYEAGFTLDQIIAKLEEEPEIALDDGKGGLVILMADRKNRVLFMKNSSGMVMDENPLPSYVEFIIQQMTMMQIAEVSMQSKIEELESQVIHFQANRLPNISFTNAAYNADQRLCEYNFEKGHLGSPLEVLIGGYNHAGKTVVEAILIEGLKKHGFNNIKRINPEEKDDILVELLEGLEDKTVPVFFEKEIRINSKLRASKPPRRLNLEASSHFNDDVKNIKGELE